MAATSTGAVGYAFGVEPMLRLVVERHAVALRNWAPRPPLRIVAVADPHVGEPFMGLSRLAGLVETANALKPDLTVLLGDYVATHPMVQRHPPDAEIARVLAGLSAPLGRYAVMGNHDWWYDKETRRRLRRGEAVGPIKLHQAFENEGIPVLENQALRLEWSKRPFWLLGLGDQWAVRPNQGVDDLPATLAQMNEDAPAILLAHEPDIFPKVPSRVGLTLSGHTHAGQIRLMGWAPFIPSRYGSRYLHGLIKEEGRSLVISAGLGCSVLPVRIGAPPELTVIEIS
ncbi:MAG: metallophosphoesterase [Rhodobacteraceae bacterium]|nr:metallophosphoesterase [Paracoccaceae bacterium]